MRVVNSRGRVLLEVTGCMATGIDAHGIIGAMYQYTGPGMGGNVDLAGLHETIGYIKADHPSVKVEGFLPQPVISQ